MPNWTENELTIVGSDIQKVLDAIGSETSEDEDARIFDFDRIIPYPQRFKDLDLRNREYQKKFYAIEYEDPECTAKRTALALEYGAEPCSPWLPDGFNSGGFEWTCDHWGTKWNAVRVKVKLYWKMSSDDLHHAFIKFDTAWSPPIPVIEKLAAMFPHNSFKLAYFEGGMGFCGKVRWEHGVELDHQQADYHGSRGG